MCYLVAKNFNSIGSYLLKTNHGKSLVDFYNKIESIVEGKDIQIVVISNPLAFGEYEPYVVCNSEKDFEEKVKKMLN